MSKAFLPAIEELKQQIAAKEAQVLAELLPLKTTANQLCKYAGLPDIYDLGAENPSSTGNGKALRFKEDQFFNKPLAGSVVTYFEARDEAQLDRPASVEDIFDALVAGGFKFEGATGNPENSKRALKIALTKNTAQFVKIGEKFALKKWYGMRAPRKQQGESGADNVSEEIKSETLDLETPNEASPQVMPSEQSS